VFRAQVTFTVRRSPVLALWATAVTSVFPNIRAQEARVAELMPPPTLTLSCAAAEV